MALAGSLDEGAGDEGGAVVEDGGGGVDAADEGPLAAADEAHAELAVERCVGRHGETPECDERMT